MRMRTAITIWIGIFIIALGFWLPPYWEAASEMKGVEQEDKYWEAYRKLMPKPDSQLLEEYKGTYLKVPQGFTIVQGEPSWLSEDQRKIWSALERRKPNMRELDEEVKQACKKEEEAKQLALKVSGLNEAPSEWEVDTGFAERQQVVWKLKKLKRSAVTGTIVWAGLGVILWGFTRRITDSTSDKVA